MQNQPGAANFASNFSRPAPGPGVPLMAGAPGQMRPMPGGPMPGMNPGMNHGMNQGMSPLSMGRANGSVAGLAALAGLCNELLEGMPRALLAISRCAGPVAPMGVPLPRR